jgi:hypothetical protein
LTLAVARSAVSVPLHPAAHGLHVLDEALAGGGGPHQRRQPGGVVVAEAEVAGERAGLEQRLELPRLRPPLVVGLVAGERAHQRTGAALGAQTGVDRPGDLHADPHHRAGERRRGAQRRLGRAGLPALRRHHRLGHEHHVDVAHVVELTATRLAHADDCEPAGRRALGQPGERHRQPGRQGGGRQVGQLARDVLDADDARQVAPGQPEQAAAVGQAQVLHHVRSGPPGAGAARPPGQRLVGRRADRVEQRPLQAVQAGAHGGELVVGQQPPVARVEHQVVGERQAGAQHPEQAPPQARAGRQRREQRSPVVRGREQAGEPGRGGVGVGGVTELGDQHLGPLVDRRPVGQQSGRGERRRRIGGLGEAQPGEPGGAGAGAGHERSSAKQTERGSSANSP